MWRIISQCCCTAVVQSLDLRPAFRNKPLNRKSVSVCTHLACCLITGHSAGIKKAACVFFTRLQPRGCGSSSVAVGLNNWTHVLICAASHAGHKLSAGSEISLPIAHRHTHAQQQRHAATGSIRTWRWSLHNVRLAFYTSGLLIAESLSSVLIKIHASTLLTDLQRKKLISKWSTMTGVWRYGCNFPGGVVLWDILWCVSQWLNISSQDAVDTLGCAHIQPSCLESKFQLQRKSSSWSQTNKTCRKHAGSTLWQQYHPLGFLPITTSRRSNWILH